MKKQKINKISLLHYFQKKDQQIYDTTRKKPTTEGLTVIGEAEGGLLTPSNEKSVFIPFC